MSAFFVGEDHVNAILSAAHLSQWFEFHLPNGRLARANDTDAMTEAGKALLSENIKSLQHRYPGDWKEMVDIDVNEFVFRFDWPFTARPDCAIATIKLVNSLDYQSCEHDEWKESWAFGFLAALIRTMIPQLRGYDDAPWHYCPEEVAA